jgi:PAS domain S-box-containing protein
MSGSVSNRSRRLLWFGVFIAIVLIGATFAVAYYNILETKVNMENEILQRQKTITSSRTETTDAWLDSLVEQSKRLVGSDLFQLFTSEVDRLPGGVPLLFAAPEESKPDGDDRSGSHVNQLSSQLPLMRTMLSEFVAYTGFSSARIVNSKAESYMSTEAVVSPLSSAQRAYVARVVETGALLYAPLEIQPKGLTLDIYLPIMPPRYQQQNSRPVAVIILTQQVDAKLTELLSPGVVEEKGRELKLVQKNGDIFQNVVPGMNQPRLVSDFPAGSRGVLPFALRKGVSNDNVDVYSSGIPLRTADWWIVAEHDASILQTALAERQKTVYILAALVSLALILLFSAVWWRLVGQEQSTINAHITDLLSLIEDQKKLLDGINSTISDPISLTDSKGTYKYVNSAFAVAVGRTVDDVVGLDSQAVFGFDTAKRLNSSDQHVLMTGDSISINEVLWLQSKRYYFQISKTPLREEGVRTPQGIVSVFRDITQLVETQERGRRVVQQTIDALVRTIEESDPFLGGHSRIMGGIAMLVAKQLRLPDSDAATIGAAANLSQIGKMYVPRAILLKPGTLTEEEKQEMERHVEHTRTILKNIEFDLPVLDAITQMNERLDGKGYPQGVTGDKISVHARVLAVANAFTAMARPRSYRPALPVEEVISILEKQRGSYDQDVVAALRQIIATPAGERLVQQAAASKVA